MSDTPPGFTWVIVTVTCQCGHQWNCSFGYGTQPLEENFNVLRPMLNVPACERCESERVKVLRDAIYPPESYGANNALSFSDLVGRVKWLRERYDWEKNKT